MLSVKAFFQFFLLLLIQNQSPEGFFLKKHFRFLSLTPHNRCKGFRRIAAVQPGPSIDPAPDKTAFFRHTAAFMEIGAQCAARTPVRRSFRKTAPEQRIRHTEAEMKAAIATAVYINKIDQLF